MKEKLRLKSWVKISLIMLTGSLLMIGFITVANERVTEIEDGTITLVSESFMAERN